MKVLFFFFVIVVALVSYRVNDVLKRKYPKGLENRKQLRWLDELGRLGNSLEQFLMRTGIDSTIPEIKYIVNGVFSLVLNPTPWRHRSPNIEIKSSLYGNVPVRVYSQRVTSSDTVTSERPVIIYFHGGGWTWLTAESYDTPLMYLANRTGFVVVAVQYRKAPQDPYPAAFEDCLFVARHVLSKAKQLNFDKELVILAGHGSGGNLAAAVSTTIGQKVKMQLLINPVLQMLNFKTPSYQEFAERFPGLMSSRRSVLNWLRYAGLSPEYTGNLLANRHVSASVHQQYADILDSSKRIPVYLEVTKKVTKGHGKSTVNNTYYFDHLVSEPTFSPMMVQNVSSLPNSYVITSQYDVYRDEAIMYTHRLHEAGVKVKLRHYPKTFHGFFLFGGSTFWNFPSSEEAMQDLVNFIKAHFIS